MKNITLTSAGSGIVAALFILVPMAYAETSGGIEANINGDVEVGKGVLSVVGTTSATIRVEANEDKEASRSKENEVEVSATENGEVQKDEQSAESEQDTKVESSSGEERGLDRAMLRANENAEEGLLNAEMHVDVKSLLEKKSQEGAAGGVEIDAATDVHSSGDFEQFIADKSKSDESIRGVDVKDGKVTVTYAMPVKFLGFWGATLDTTASADVSGNVSFEYPWYSVFMKKDFSKMTVEPVIKAEIEAQQGAVTSASLGGTTTPIVARTFAAPHVFEAMIKAMGKVRGGWDIKANTK